MILADTQIWINHLRSADPKLSSLLAEDCILCHPFVVGEIAVGMYRARDVVLENLRRLSTTVVATDDEVLKLIGDKQLYGRGVGYIDVHLLASVLLTPETRLWTEDRRLDEVATSLGVAYQAIQ